ncbi:hypothetical protein HPB47_025052 [Ixodes persulcatus]|uniref:Uncharacterized protein n=1 Tax=Ixodes persulcatus TaxID=34615 RepID=A0AC60Q3A1_IXOPE|nr:hypothetical protein HPB47_025052 [Ixodes persulcatus]
MLIWMGRRIKTERLCFLQLALVTESDKRELEAGLLLLAFSVSVSDHVATMTRRNPNVVEIVELLKDSTKLEDFCVCYGLSPNPNIAMLAP